MCSSSPTCFCSFRFAAWNSTQHKFYPEPHWQKLASEDTECVAESRWYWDWDESLKRLAPSDGIAAEGLHQLRQQKIFSLLCGSNYSHCGTQMLSLGSSDLGWSDEIKHKLKASFRARQNLPPRVAAEQTVGSCWLSQSAVAGPKDVTEEDSKGDFCSKPRDDLICSSPVKSHQRVEQEMTSSPSLDKKLFLCLGVKSTTSART